MKEVSMWVKVGGAVIILLLTFSGAMMTMLYNHQVDSVKAEVIARKELEVKMDAAVKLLGGRVHDVEITMTGLGTNIANLVVTCADIKKDIRELRSP